MNAVCLRGRVHEQPYSVYRSRSKLYALFNRFPFGVTYVMEIMPVGIRSAGKYGNHREVTSTVQWKAGDVDPFHYCVLSR